MTVMTTETKLEFRIGSREPDECGPDCPDFIRNWLGWAAQNTASPLALLDCSGEYFDRLDSKSRAMVRQANRNYTYRAFAYNDHLAEIEEINLSKPERQGRPMRGWYTSPPEPTRPADLCDAHRDTWYGGFDLAGKLVGYCRLEQLNELGILNSILGHRDARGVMNGMFAHLVYFSGVRWINYLRMEAASDGLTAFKKSVGFAPVRVEITA